MFGTWSTMFFVALHDYSRLAFPWRFSINRRSHYVKSSELFYCFFIPHLINIGLCFNFLVILRFMAAFKSSSRIGKVINSCDNDIYTSAIFSTILLYCGSLFTNCSTNLVLEMQQLSMIFSFVAALAIHSMLNLSNIIADGSTRFLFKVWFSNIFVLALGFVPFSSRFKNSVTICAWYRLSAVTFKVKG